MANNMNVLEWALGTDNKPSTAANRAMAFEEISAVLYQMSKIQWGAAGVVNQTSLGTPLPISPIFNGAAWGYGNRPAFDQYYGGSILSSTNRLPVDTGSNIATVSSKTGNVTIPAATTAGTAVPIATATTGEVSSRTIQNNTKRDQRIDIKGVGGAGIGFTLYANGGAREFNKLTKVPTGAVTATPVTTLNADSSAATDGDIYFEELV